MPDKALDLYRQMNTIEAANFLDLTPRMLELMRQRGNGPIYLKISPRCVKYRLKELIDWQDALLKKSTIEI
ncbi:MAG: DNA-binding protein [Candidatus Thiodiazotropha sp. (ex Troendleina suluensis)]|nr:DNA-binding protein [Candidatus Thiodiazotropha sp. (ex Troendleina suluensis)]